MEQSGGDMIQEQVYSASYFTHELRLKCIKASNDEAALKQAWILGSDLVGLYNHTKDTTVF